MPGDQFEQHVYRSSIPESGEAPHGLASDLIIRGGR
jgi:hypothetical protein